MSRQPETERAAFFERAAEQHAEWLQADDVMVAEADGDHDVFLTYLRQSSATRKANG